jgi:hypothetical protein
MREAQAWATWTKAMSFLLDDLLWIMRAGDERSHSGPAYGAADAAPEGPQVASAGNSKFARDDDAGTDAEGMTADL